MQAALAWVIATDALPAVNVAVRVLPVFAATLKLRVPLPVVAVVVVVTHEAELDGVHVQEPPASTSTLPAPPAAPTATLVGFTW